VTRTDNPGTHRLIQGSAEAGAQAQRARVWTDAERQAWRETAKRLDLGPTLIRGYHDPWWTDEELALRGTLPDAEVAARIGRTVQAVRVKRQRAGIGCLEEWGATAVPIANT
jgi:hypothetical protein